MKSGKTFSMFLLLALVGLVTSDTVIFGQCYQCGGDTCYVYHGGPFDGEVIRTNLFTSCNQSRVFYEFRCDSSCDYSAEGCYLGGSQSLSTCYDRASGKTVANFLDILYSLLEGNSALSSQYDWCDCGLSPGQVAGIVIGSVIGACLLFCILGCIIY